MKSKPLLEAKNINVQYRNLNALDDASIFLNPGEIIALMGPNGAGKSTFLKALFGLQPIRSGEVLWNGEVIAPNPKEMIECGTAYIPQGRRVLKSLTVKENLEIGAYSISSQAEIDERFVEVLNVFPMLKVKLGVRAGTLSGGQQQMLSIARGLMTNPKVLLIDEPSIGLAPNIVAEVFEKLRYINNTYGVSCIIVEHNLQLVSEIAHRMYILDKGSVVAVGEAQELLQNRVLEKVFLGNL